MKYTTPTKKGDILEIIIAEFEKAKEECKTYSPDRLYYGKYVALIDLLAKIKIYEKED